MPFAVAIIGGGWYGCHLALTLHNLGFEIKLFEEGDRLFGSASANNQFRLHMGFHYARHHNTRLQSRDGFFRFIERYPSLSASVDKNIYAVPKIDSLIDYSTYKLIMQSSGLTFSELVEIPDGLINVEGAMLTPERVIKLSTTRNFFNSELKEFVVFNHCVKKIDDRGSYIVVDGEKFDFAIDATWGHFSRPCIPIFYEPTLLLYYEKKISLPAFTFVDGPLYSVYPTDDPEIFTLSSVVHTPLNQFSDSSDARASLRQISKEVVVQKKRLMEDQCRRNLANFSEWFKFVGIQLAIKTKPTGATDDRSCYVERRGRLFIVMSGKIDTIFYAAERILFEISSDHAIGPRIAESRLREEIKKTDLLMQSPTLPKS